MYEIMHDLEQLAHSKLRSRYPTGTRIASASSQFDSSSACMPNLHTMGELFYPGMGMRRLFDLSVMLHFVVSTTNTCAIRYAPPSVSFFFAVPFYEYHIIITADSKYLYCLLSRNHCHFCFLCDANILVVHGHNFNH